MKPGRPRPDDQGLRSARPWRRRLPHRHEVGLPAPAGRRPPLPRRQRRRVRAGHLQGHPADDGGAAVPHRGRASSPPSRSAATTPSSTCAARSCTSTAACCARWRRPMPRATSARTSTARASTSTSPCTPAPAPTSVARRPRCSTASRVAAASRASSRRSPPSPGSTPARPWSTTSSRSPRSRRSCCTAPTGSPTWAPRSRRASASSASPGHVKRPGQYEAPLGITLRELLDMAGGMRDPNKNLKFWTPGGSSTPLFTAEHLDTPLDFESVAAAGSMLGTRALQIFDETTCVVRAVDRWTDFYKHESCGKCTPCREGTWWLKQILGRLEHGQGVRGGPREAARHLRQHPRPQLLRPRGRCDEPDHEQHPVLPRGVPRPPHARRLPVRPDGLHPVREGEVSA